VVSDNPKSFLLKRTPADVLVGVRVAVWQSTKHGPLDMTCAPRGLASLTRMAIGSSNARSGNVNVMTHSLLVSTGGLTHQAPWN
jgi:hypothetical protein